MVMEERVDNTTTNQARSFAEEGLEEIREESAAAEAAVPEASNATATSPADEEEDLVQVGGLEPVAFFYRTTPPKPGKEPKQPYKVLSKGDTIEGTYERSFTAGKFDNKTYIVRQKDGQLVGLPGTGSLSKSIEKLQEGSRVKIVYEGMSEIKAGKWKGSDAHNFTVFGSKLKA